NVSSVHNVGDEGRAVDTDRATSRSGRGTSTRAGAVIRSSRLRPAVWGLHLLLPLLGLWLLIAEPGADLRWEQHEAHFALVLTTALIAAGIGVVIAGAARAHHDARIFLVACGFLAVAGFFAVHALTTPMVLIEVSSHGWNASTTVGLLVASFFAVASSFDLAHAARGRWVLDHAAAILAALGLVVTVWLVASLAQIPPFDETVVQDEARGQLGIVAGAAVALFLVATVRYWWLYRRRPAAVLLSVLTAWALLAEAATATAIGRSWQLSWWLWHVLIVLAFAFVAYSAHVQYRREGAAGVLFRGIALDETLNETRAGYQDALEGLVAAMHEREHDERDVTRLTAAVAEQFGLTEAQRAVLEEAALALRRERETTDQLSGLVAVSRSTTVLDDEHTWLQRAELELDRRFRRDRVTIAVLHDGVLTPVGGAPPSGPAAAAVETRAPVERDGEIVWPLLVKDEVAGVVGFERPRGAFDAGDRAMAASVASQLGVQLENTRLYSTIDMLFRRYMAPNVVTRLLADPDQAALGGAVVEVTALFGDLRGFTTYAEHHDPADVVALLNRYYAAIVPRILEEEGTVMSYAGDAVMAVFNAPTRQPDHAQRAARVALAMRDAVQTLTADAPDMPGLGIGINTGPALVGNIGAELRDYTVIGDAVNVASRLEGVAAAGEVLVGATTRERLGGDAVLEAAGSFDLKGKAEPVPAWRLVAVP
ncbi:MAG TPA: adenylate/guanylate cyclase domain-containing protein, partial [Acidimicrobiia bacterium]|nr:adenylate/guanylate cyclase domain-containing protein [Acidimicrobiia bacterium]